MARQVAQFGWQREYDVKVMRRQDAFQATSNPLGLRQSLALWTPACSSVPVVDPHGRWHHTCQAAVLRIALRGVPFGRGTLASRSTGLLVRRIRAGVTCV